MVNVWCDRLLAGTRQFEKVPPSLKNAVIETLKLRLDKGEISEDDLKRALSYSGD